MSVNFDTVSIQHLDCNYEISYFLRPGTKGTMVYLHGLGSTKHDFFGAVNQPGFADFTLFAFDFPGSGNSSYSEGVRLGIDDLVEILNKIFSLIVIDEVLLVGHSMGGLVGLLFADRYPNRVERFINVEGNVAREDCDIFSRRAAQLTWLEFVERDFMGDIENEFKRSPFSGARGFAQALRKAVAAKPFHDYCISIVDKSDRDELLTVFKDLPMRRAFIYGEANKQLSYLTDLRNSGVSVFEVTNSHHWPHFDNPEFYFETIRGFLAK